MRPCNNYLVQKAKINPVTLIIIYTVEHRLVLIGQWRREYTGLTLFAPIPQDIDMS